MKKCKAVNEKLENREGKKNGEECSKNERGEKRFNGEIHEKAFCDLCMQTLPFDMAYACKLYLNACVCWYANRPSTSSLFFFFK